MSDTAKMDEIDEVLSSVRKLVSNGDKQAAKPAASTPPNPFLLTPALRVEGAQAEEKASPTAETAPAPAPEPAPTDSKAAALEAAVTAQSDSWEAEEGESLDPATWAASAFLRQNVAEPVDDAAPAEEAEVAILADDADKVESEQAEAADSAEAVVEDEPEAESSDAPAAEAAGTTAPDPAAVLAGIDPDTLRKLVVDILREELAGDMGERMTRNVRKLVRREINRVLVSRDLD